MSRHILEIALDSIEQAKLDAGEYVFPEHVDSREYHIRCPSGNGCSGWLSCNHPHEVDGVSANRGPDECCGALFGQGHEDDCLGDSLPWRNRDEFVFHDELHMWQYGWGWVLPYVGCVVNYDCELPDNYDDLPIGEYEVDSDWDDFSCYLTLVDA